MAYRNIKFKLKSTAPLLMHSDRLANPILAESQELKKLTGIRKKTEENHIEIAKLSFLGSMYPVNEAGEVCIPSNVLEGAILGAAKLKKMGTTVKRALMIAEPDIKLDYEGPKTPEGLWGTPKFVDCRSVDVQGSRVMRYRPRFDKWSMTFDVTFDDEQIDDAQIVGFVQDAGTKIGLCDYRPKFGRFSVEKVEII